MTLDNFEWLLILVIGSILIGLVKYLFGVVVDNHKATIKLIQDRVSELTTCLEKNELSFEEFRTSSEAKEDGIYEKIEKTFTIVEKFSERMDALSTQMGALNSAREFEIARVQDHEKRLRRLEELVSELRYKNNEV